jgi:tetratricopeptide (TPR) repeat protein
MSPLRPGLFALLLAVPALAGPVPDGPTDEQLKQAALKLNQAGTPEATFAAAGKLLKPKADARRLVKIAAKMQRDADKPPLKFNAALALAEVARRVKEYDAAEGLLESCQTAAREVSSPSKMLEVQTELVELYWDQKKWPDAETALKTAMELKEKQPAEDGQHVLQLIGLYERFVQVKALQGDTDEAVRMADELRKKFPIEPLRPLFLLPKAAALSEGGKPAEAVKAIKAFLDAGEDLGKAFKPEGVTAYQRRAKYQMSGYQVDAGDVDGAVKTLRDLLEDNPDSATFHNDLGFVLADHDRELEEAERLCRKALELDAEARKKLADAGDLDADAAKRENAAYLDSLGWVLFKQGKHKEALPYLEKAAADEDDGRHIEIWDHWADCLMKLGQKDKAIATWEKCLTFDDVSKRDVERRKKVSGKLKAAKQK